MFMVKRCESADMVSFSQIQGKTAHNLKLLVFLKSYDLSRKWERTLQIKPYTNQLQVHNTHKNIHVEVIKMQGKAKLWLLAACH